MIYKRMDMEFHHKLKVDDSHVIYFTKEIEDYYLMHQCDINAIKRDVEDMLDEFDILDYEEIYLYFKDKDWTITYTRCGKVVTVTQ